MQVLFCDHLHQSPESGYPGFDYSPGTRRGRALSRPLPVMIGRFKSYTDHGYRGLTDKKTPGLWQRGFYDHVIRNDADLDAARRYVRNNPVKKQERESIYAEKETTQ